MVLSDVDIRRYIERGKIRISPELPPEQFGSCSVDFRLGAEFSVFEHSRHPYIDVRDTSAIQGIMRSIIVKPGEPFILQPREFALAITDPMTAMDTAPMWRESSRETVFSRAAPIP
jgi:dCTP deaminase